MTMTRKQSKLCRFLTNVLPNLLLIVALMYALVVLVTVIPS